MYIDIYVTAWLLRLSEITKNNGLVVIASQSRQWDRENLLPTLTEKGYAFSVPNYLDGIVFILPMNLVFEVHIHV